MRADRFLTWLFFAHGLHVVDARERLTADERSAFLTKWIALGCPHAIGV